MAILYVSNSTSNGYSLGNDGAADAEANLTIAVAADVQAVNIIQGA